MIQPTIFLYQTEGERYKQTENKERQRTDETDPVGHDTTYPTTLMVRTK